MELIQGLLTSATAWLFMAGQARYWKFLSYQRVMLTLALSAVAAKGLVRVAMMAADNVRHPPEWDFLIFWINGFMASRGLNFYDSGLAMQVAAPFHPDSGFVDIQLGVPFMYPPPSIIWFLPLGLGDIHLMAMLWYAIQLACLCASVVLLARIFIESAKDEDDRHDFFRSASASNFAFVAALLLMIRATYWNVAHAQTVFLLLLFLSLAFRGRDGKWGGVWLGLAILVKPVAIFVMLYALAQRKWQLLVGSVITVLAATLATLVVFGRAVFASYAAIRFAALPRPFYTEMENQSLLAWILRITHAQTSFPLTYWMIAGLCGAALLWRLSVVNKSNESAGFLLALTCGLLLYPGSLRSYLVLLILPILALYRAKIWIPPALACGLMYPVHGDYAVLSTLIMAVTLAVWMPGLSAAEGTLPATSQLQPGGVRV